MEFAGHRRVETLKALEKSMKRRGVVLTVLGLFLFLGAGFIAFLMFFVGKPDAGSVIFGIFLSVFSLFGLATLIFAFRYCFRPAKFQDVFDRAAELYGDIVYENDYFICSQRYIGSKINQFAIENGIDFDVDAVSQKIEELIGDYSGFFFKKTIYKVK